MLTIIRAVNIIRFGRIYFKVVFPQMTFFFGERSPICWWHGLDYVLCTYHLFALYCFALYTALYCFAPVLHCTVNYDYKMFTWPWEIEVESHPFVSESLKMQGFFSLPQMFLQLRLCYR